MDMCVHKLVDSCPWNSSQTVKPWYNCKVYIATLTDLGAEPGLCYAHV